ncbi:MAG: ABC transporter substrate-binding protein [Vitreoscilla sp.]|nr:ABC transporter substrate-binding protein [Vitreoscilla sp.]MBP6676472.1 ABC transporter substrate-binding protein [Vitreoscilla sp.]
MTLRSALTFSVALVLSQLASSPSAQAQSPAKPQPIRIGLILPLTGGSSDMGNSARVGAQVAVDEVNEVGGYLGRPFELVVRDDKATPDVGLHWAEELVTQEKVLATIGYCNTGVAAKALDVFQKNKHVLIVPCATGTVLTTKYPARESYIFRTSARDELQTEFLVAELAKRKLTRPALMVDKSGYGDAGLADLLAALERHKIKPAIVVRFAVGAKTLIDEVNQAKAAGADSMIGWTVGPESGVLAAARAETKWKVPQFGSWCLSHRSAFETSRGAVEGTMSVQTVLPNNFLERNAAFRLHYRKLSNESPIGSMMSAAQTYDAVHLLLRAMFVARQDLSGPALKHALENLPNRYAGVVSNYQRPFSSDDHDAVSANMLWLGTWRYGERDYYYPEDARRATVIRQKEGQAH